MKIHQILSKPKLGMKNNQDSVGVSKKKSGIWVIDGITEISPIQLTSGSKSVSWFVNQLSEYLTQYLDQIDFTITEILVNAVKKIRKEFKALKPSNIDLSNLYEQPSASIIVARNNQDKGQELFSLGDCVAYLHSSNQEYLIQNEELK
ncbi:MAG: protein phosphatase 2C domain-containing protein, partial [Candidatus Hodarchaeota archaeon]